MQGNDHPEGQHGVGPGEPHHIPHGHDEVPASECPGEQRQIPTHPMAWAGVRTVRNRRKKPTTAKAHCTSWRTRQQSAAPSQSTMAVDQSPKVVGVGQPLAVNRQPISSLRH